MNKIEKWNELCFILSKSINPEINEDKFELKVIQAFEKLGWSEYKKEIIVRESIRLGSASRITPDLIIKSHILNKNLFVIEIKKPSVTINNSGFKDQLSSYMRMLKLNFGILIGSKIQIYSDDSEIFLNELNLIEEYEFEYDNEKGIEFIELFEKDNFQIKRIQDFVQEKLKIKNNLKLEKTIKKKILSSDYQETIKGLIKSDILNKFEINSIDRILNEISIKVESNIDNMNYLQIDSIKKHKSKNPKILGNYKKDFQNSSVSQQISSTNNFKVQILDSVNFYGLIEMKQIMFCINQVKNENNVILYTKMHNKPINKYGFSPEGLAYLKTLHPLMESNYIADFEIIPLKSNNLLMWERLYNSKLFPFWDPKDGPFSYNSQKLKSIAICRVYKIPTSITRDDYGKYGIVKRTISNEEINLKIKANLNNKIPLIDDTKFNNIREEILSIINDYN